MAIPIDQDLHQEVKDYIRDKYGSKKKVISYFRKGSWQTSRYIQVSTCLKDSDIHYEYYNGEVQLHFEGKYAEDGFKDFKKYLVEIKPYKFTMPPATPKRKTKKYIEEMAQYMTNQAKWEAARNACRNNNTNFMILTENELGIGKR